MGLRTASVRHPHVVMAPALTETTQSQGFNLVSKTRFSPSSPLPVNSFEVNKYYVVNEGESANGTKKSFLSKQKYGNENEVQAKLPTTLDKLPLIHKQASDNSESLKRIMNSSFLSMGDHDDKMGLQKTEVESVLSSIHKDGKLTSDDEQLLNNFNSGSDGSATGDLTPNVDDIMQVITSIEGERGNDLNEEVFSTDLATNLSSFEKQLLSDVALMNMSIEEPQDSIDTVEDLKEARSQEIIAESQKKQAKVQRKLDFLRRRALKLQARLMGQHVSGEVAGVYEEVHRSLKRLKDSAVSQEAPKGVELSFNEETSLPLPLPAPVEHYSPNDDIKKPMSYALGKSLARKMEMSSIIQANAASRQKHVAKYFGSGSLDAGNLRSNVAGTVNIPPWPLDQKLELQKLSGQVSSQLRFLQADVDSEATESSSGGESCDEFQTYSNQHQQYLSIQKRALWKYSTDRASIAARWTWLQVQISDLEYRIRQHTELHRQVRIAKGPVHLEGQSPPPTPPSPTNNTLNGYRCLLPPESTSKDLTSDNNSDNADFQCARTRPLHTSFKKRKLLQTSKLHVISKKAARPSTVRCGCIGTPCALCTGRKDPTHPRDTPETLGRNEKVALIDPAFHPVFSTSEDISESVHLEAIMKLPEWQQRSTRMKNLKGYTKAERVDKTLDHRGPKPEHRKKYNKLLKPSTMSALSAKLKNKLRGRKSSRHGFTRMYRKRHTSNNTTIAHHFPADGAIDEEVESIGANSVSRSTGVSPSMSPLLHMQSISGFGRKNRINSYDIDNIVIPYSVAASTRVEKLQYKEILTPKWRIAESDIPVKNDAKNGVVTTSQDSDQEDLTEESVIVRHDKSEHDEKKKFLSYLKFPLGYGRRSSHKRTDSRAESSGANTPDPMSPHPVEPDPASSPIGSPPILQEEEPLPSVSVMRRRTISQTRFLREAREDSCSTMPEIEVAPFESFAFPLDDDTYEKMLRHMPEDHQLKTNTRAQDNTDCGSDYIDSKVGSPDSESTESALAEEDPNDPEWIEVERARDRHKR